MIKLHFSKSETELHVDQYKIIGIWSHPSYGTKIRYGDSEEAIFYVEESVSEILALIEAAKTNVCSIILTKNNGDPFFLKKDSIKMVHTIQFEDLRQTVVGGMYVKETFDEIMEKLK